MRSKINRRRIPGAGWWVRNMMQQETVGHVHRCRECGGLIRLGDVCRVCHVELRKVSGNARERIPTMEAI